MSYGNVVGPYSQFTNDEKIAYALNLSLAKITVDAFKGNYEWYKSPDLYEAINKQSILSKSVPSYNDIKDYYCIVTVNNVEYITNKTVDDILTYAAGFKLSDLLGTNAEILSGPTFENSDAPSGGDFDNGLCNKLPRQAFAFFVYWKNKLTGMAVNGSTNFTGSGTWPESDDRLSVKLTLNSSGDINTGRTYEKVLTGTLAEPTLMEDLKQYTPLKIINPSFITGTIDQTNGVGIPDSLKPYVLKDIVINVGVPTISTWNGLTNSNNSDNIAFFNPLLTKSLNETYGYNGYGLGNGYWIRGTDSGRTNITPAYGSSAVGEGTMIFSSMTGFVLFFGVSDILSSQVGVSVINPPCVTALRYTGETFADGIISQGDTLPDPAVSNDKDLFIDTSTNTLHRCENVEVTGTFVRIDAQKYIGVSGGQPFSELEDLTIGDELILKSNLASAESSHGIVTDAGQQFWNTTFTLHNVTTINPPADAVVSQKSDALRWTPVGGGGGGGGSIEQVNINPDPWLKEETDLVINTIDNTLYRINVDNNGTVKAEGTLPEIYFQDYYPGETYSYTKFYILHSAETEFTKDAPIKIDNGYAITTISVTELNSMNTPKTVTPLNDGTFRTTFHLLPGKITQGYKNAVASQVNDGTVKTWKKVDPTGVSIQLKTALPPIVMAKEDELVIKTTGTDNTLYRFVVNEGTTPVVNAEGTLDNLTLHTDTAGATYTRMFIKHLPSTEFTNLNPITINNGYVSLTLNVDQLGDYPLTVEPWNFDWVRTKFTLPGNPIPAGYNGISAVSQVNFDVTEKIWKKVGAAIKQESDLGNIDAVVGDLAIKTTDDTMWRYGLRSGGNSWGEVGKNQTQVTMDGTNFTSNIVNMGWVQSYVEAPSTYANINFGTINASISGSASTASLAGQLNVYHSTIGDWHYICFSNAYNQTCTIYANSGLKYIPSSHTLYCTNINGTVTNVKISLDSNSTSEHFVCFASSTSGSRQIKANWAFSFKPSTRTLTCDNFNGTATSATSATFGSTRADSDDSTYIATTKFVKNQGYATLESPSFTGFVSCQYNKAITCTSSQGHTISISCYAGNLTGYTGYYGVLKCENYLYLDIQGKYVGHIGSSWIGSVTFTGQHPALPEDPELVTNLIKYIGRIVCANGSVSTIVEDISGNHSIQTNKQGITINNSIPQVKLCNSYKDKTCFGIISDEEDMHENGDKEFRTGCLVSVVSGLDENDNRLFINSVGEGAIWVNNRHGNIENGDYITTDLIGYGTKQDDDLMHNYTMAKATISCNFELDSDDYECKDVEDYKVAFISCVYCN